MSEQAMQAHTDARTDDAMAPRAWATLLVGGLMALPLVNVEAIGSLACLIRHTLRRSDSRVPIDGMRSAPPPVVTPLVVARSRRGLFCLRVSGLGAQRLR